MGMPTDERRHEDDRLVRVEEKVIELYAKVTNGITDRGIRTENMVKEIKDRHDAFEKAFLNHLLKEEIEQHDMTSALDGISKSITALSKAQEGWVKAKNRMILLSFTGLISIIGFLIMHSEGVSKLMHYIAKG